MSEGKNHREQFEKYISGKLSAEEAHAFERASLDDPFTLEALEGFELQGAEKLTDLVKLERQLATRKQRRNRWLPYASAAALVLVGGLTLYLLRERFDKRQELATADEVFEKEEASPQAADTITAPHSILDEAPAEVVATAESAPIQEAEATPATPPVAKEADEEAFFAATSEDIEALLTEEVAPSEPKAEAAPIDVESVKSALQLAQTSEQSIDAEPLPVLPNVVAETLSEAADPPAFNESRARKSSAGAVARSFSALSPIVRGTVTDIEGQPLPGVNVLIQGTASGTQTNVDGSYVLDSAQGVTLAFSYVGFETLEVAVGDRNVVDVSLGGSLALQEVVVTGYSGDDLADSPYSGTRPTGGTGNYRQYLKASLRYPDAARQNEIEGTVTLEVTISSTGSVEAIAVKKSLGYGCDEEAIRLVQEGPGWEPAERSGVKVAETVKVKVKFTL